MPAPGPRGLLVHARWPESDARWRDEGLEARFEFAQELVTRLREVRARYQVAPSARVPVVIRAGGEAAARLAGLEELVRGMAGCASVHPWVPERIPTPPA